MGEKDFDLADAYAVKTPDDNRHLYASWADTYESGFVSDNGYLYHFGVAGVFLAEATSSDGPVLDVGCGTGLVGEALRSEDSCPIPLDGLDLSPEMLELARTKQVPDKDEPVYRSLHVGDLTGSLDLADGRYGGITSCGTFTHGHVGPTAFDELYRITRPGALFAIGINPDHFRVLGFSERFASDAEVGIITQPIIHRVATYGLGPNVDQMSPVAVFRRN